MYAHDRKHHNQNKLGHRMLFKNPNFYYCNFLLTVLTSKRKKNYINNAVRVQKEHPKTDPKPEILKAIKYLLL